MLRNKKVRFHYITADKVKEESEKMKPYWEKVLSITGTRQVHSVRCRGYNTVLVAQVSTAEDLRAEVFMDSESDSDMSNKSSDELSDNDSQVENVNSDGDSLDKQICNNIDDIKVGDFLGVEYASEKMTKKIFITQVANIDEDETLLEVIKMKRCGKSSMFVIQPDDQCWVDVKQIKFKFNQPTLDQRGRYAFSSLPDYLLLLPLSTICM